MTDQNRPITPSKALEHKWASMFEQHSDMEVFTEVARWGADQELEACCEVLARELICDGKHVATDLRMIRRPKPPSLNVITKEQALSEVAAAVAGGNITPERGAAIRRALEALDD